MITDLDYYKYKKGIEQGYSQREMCQELGIARSTMQDYIARKDFLNARDTAQCKAAIKKSVKTSTKLSQDNTPHVFSPAFEGPVIGFKSREDNSRILCISDLHIPYEHPDAFAFLQHLKDKYQPTRVICMGDELDKHALSFHDSDPDLDSAGAEMKKSLVKIKALHKIFPKMDILDSNHGSLVYRKAKANGIPKHFLKNYNEFLEVDSGWQWHFDLTVKLPNGQDCYFHHGKTNRVGLLSQQMGMNAVQGHFHQDFCIHYWANPNGIYWGLQTGCLIDDKSLAFSYNNVNIKRPIIGTGLIIDSLPILEPMVLSKGGRWNR